MAIMASREIVMHDQVASSVCPWRCSVFIKGYMSLQSLISSTYYSMYIQLDQLKETRTLQSKLHISCCVSLSPFLTTVECPRQNGLYIEGFRMIWLYYCLYCECFNKSHYNAVNLAIQRFAPSQVSNLVRSTSVWPHHHLRVRGWRKVSIQWGSAIVKSVFHSFSGSYALV